MASLGLLNGTKNVALPHTLSQETEDGQDEEDEQLRNCCTDVLSELLCAHTNTYLVVGDTKGTVVIFDEAEFLATRTRGICHLTDRCYAPSAFRKSSALTG